MLTVALNLLEIDLVDAVVHLWFDQSDPDAARNLRIVLQVHLQNRLRHVEPLEVHGKRRSFVINCKLYALVWRNSGIRMC